MVRNPITESVRDFRPLVQEVWTGLNLCSGHPIKGTLVDTSCVNDNELLGGHR